jgi:hypothetical protein
VVSFCSQWIYWPEFVCVLVGVWCNVSHELGLWRDIGVSKNRKQVMKFLCTDLKSECGVQGFHTKSQGLCVFFFKKWYKWWLLCLINSDTILQRCNRRRENVWLCYAGHCHSTHIRFSATEVFGKWLITRGLWHSRSPVFNTWDFYLWRFLKDRT